MTLFGQRQVLTGNFRALARTSISGLKRHNRVSATAPLATSSPPDEPASREDEQYMAKALAFARKGLGSTYPNPAVGCVLVQHGQVIGEGFHPKAGEPHAEIFALRAAGQQAQGATAFVTLEPCNHYGKTPPCSLALVEAKVARVVVGVVDPNPLVGGQGIAALRKAGIDVTVGCLEADCWEINKEFMDRMASKAAV